MQKIYKNNVDNLDEMFLEISENNKILTKLTEDENLIIAGESVS